MNKKDKKLQKHLVDEIMENYEKLEQENKQLKEQLENKIDLYEDTISYQLGFDKGEEFYQEKLDIALEDNKQLENIRIKAIEKLTELMIKQDIKDKETGQKELISKVGAYKSLIDLLKELENEWLFARFKNRWKTNDKKNELKIKELEQKIDKTIEYITTEQLYANYQWGKTQYEKILKDLLKILGGNNESNWFIK